MWLLVTAILYLTCVRAYQRPANFPNPAYINDQNAINNPRKSPYTYNAASPYYDYNLPDNYNNNYGRIPVVNNLQAPLAAPPFNNYNAKYVAAPFASSYYLRSNFGQSQSSPKTSRNQGTDAYPFDLDYSSSNGGSDVTLSEPPPVIEPRSVQENPSYSDDLELAENFGNYLKRRTQLDPSSSSINDAAHQYNALLAVLVALARVVRNSCEDFDLVYEREFTPTVETYYRHGMANPEKVANMIEDYIQKGNARMPKIRKLKQEVCDKELFCSKSVDNHIKNSQLVYIKELETLEAITHLARSYYPYIDEFTQAAQNGNVLSYLKSNKEKLKNYTMNVINSVEHLADKQVKCP